MSILTFPSHTGSPRTPRRGAGGLLSGAVQWWRNHQADLTLRGMSDEMLHDIGISRGEIGDVVQHGRPSRY